MVKSVIVKTITIFCDQCISIDVHHFCRDISSYLIPAESLSYTSRQSMVICQSISYIYVEKVFPRVCIYSDRFDIIINKYQVIYP